MPPRKPLPSRRGSNTNHGGGGGHESEAATAYSSFIFISIGTDRKRVAAEWWNNKATCCRSCWWYSNLRPLVSDSNSLGSSWDAYQYVLPDPNSSCFLVQPSNDSRRSWDIIGLKRENIWGSDLTLEACHWQLLCPIDNLLCSTFKSIEVESDRSTAQTIKSLKPWLCNINQTHRLR